MTNWQDARKLLLMQQKLQGLLLAQGSKSKVVKPKKVESKKMDTNPVVNFFQGLEEQLKERFASPSPAY